MLDRTARIVFAKELREVLRDRRTVLAAFVLPFFLYPLLVLWMSSVERGQAGFLGGEDRATKTLAVAVVADGGPEAMEPLLRERNLTVEGAAVDLDALRSGKLAAICVLDGGEAAIHYSSTSSDSREARSRLDAVLDAYRHQRVQRLFASRDLRVQPAEIARVELIDLASAAERSASKLGKILPFFLVLISLLGGSFAAIDLVAGEKERGTLETLFIHPADRKSIVNGKFLVVAATTGAALVSNLTGLAVGIAAARAAGRQADGFDVDVSALASPALLAGLGLIAAPLVVLSSAALLSISAYSRSFREAQTYLLPVTLLSLPILLLGVAPGMTLGSIVAWVPVAGSTLAVRELLDGKLTVPHLAIVLGTSSLYAWLALRLARSLLEREDLLHGVEEPMSLARAEGRARRAVFWASLLLLVIYFAGSWIQAVSLKWGLLATLLGLVLAPGLLYPLRHRASYRETLALRRPGMTAVLLSPLVALALAVLAAGYSTVQDKVLPMPTADQELYAQLGAWSLAEKAFLLCILPGVCEEVLWRGAFQGELEARRRPLRTAALVGLFFGIFHLSAYRLIPTGLVGAGLALWRQRTGSIFPGMIVHTAYNAILIVAAGMAGVAEDLAAEQPWASAAALLVLLLAWRMTRPAGRTGATETRFESAW